MIRRDKEKSIPYFDQLFLDKGYDSDYEEFTISYGYSEEEGLHEYSSYLVY